MGKAVPQNIKSRANDLIKAYPDELTSDFEADKTFVNSLGMPLSKPQRNLVAGYIARQKAKQKQK